MKIGIMLRHLNQHGGGVLYTTHSLLRRILAMDLPHEFVLIYQNPRFLGTFGDGVRVREIAINAPHIFLWDQVVMRYAERREKFDIIYNPKYSLPLTAKCKTVFTSRGLDWYVMPWGSKWVDRMSHRYLIPRYAKKADAIIAVSETTRQHVIKYLGVAEEKVHTVYHGIEDAFAEPIPQERLDEIKCNYGLPDRFFLYCGQIYPPKNFGRLLQAYAKVGPEQNIALVVAGQHTWLCEKELDLLDRLDLTRWVHWPGWIDREALPGFYAMAEALVIPSLYESFCNPLLEAMACSCPIVTANRYGTAEIAGNAAVLVDPENIMSIADGMSRVANDEDLKKRLIKAGHERVKNFSWDKCARETIQVLENVLA